MRRGTDDLAVRRARRKRSAGDYPDKKVSTITIRTWERRILKNAENHEIWNPVKLEEEGNGLELVVEEEEDEDEGIGDFEEDEAVEVEREQEGNNGHSEGGKW